MREDAEAFGRTERTVGDFDFEAALAALQEAAASRGVSLEEVTT